MKTLIVYSSTYGFAEKCAQELAKKLGGTADAVNVSASAAPALSEYDCVVLGGSVYMGQVQKKLKDYISSNIAELKSKKVGLFLCCGMPENLEQDFQLNFPKELLDAAAARECFGGVLDTSKMSFGHKMIVKMMESAAKKEGKPLPAPLPQNIARLAGAMGT